MSVGRFFEEEAALSGRSVLLPHTLLLAVTFIEPVCLILNVFSLHNTTQLHKKWNEMKSNQVISRTFIITHITKENYGKKQSKEI